MYRCLANLMVLCGTLFLSSLQGVWSASVNVSTLHQPDFFPQIAVNSNGDATAVWYNQSLDAIQASSKPFGGSWEDEQTISLLPIVQHSWEAARVAMDGHGNATAVWKTRSGGNLIQTSTKPFGSPWQEQPDTISVDPSDNSTPPQIAVDSNGNATVVWTGIVGADVRLQASTRPFGGSWQAPVNVSQPGVSVQFVSITVDSNGNVIAVWFASNGPTRLIQAATKPFEAAWQAPETIAQTTPQALPPQVAVDGHGNTTAVWQGSDGTNFFVQSSFKPFGEAWQATPDTLPGSQQVQDIPRIAMDSVGNATAVWTASNGTNFFVQAATKPFGVAWQDPETISVNSESAFTPQIAVDSVGNATAVWNASSGTNSVIQTATKPFGGSWQSTPNVISLPDQIAQFPQIAVDGSGNATAIWNSQFEESSVIQAATNSSTPTVISVRPTSGPKKGGNTVTITGTNFVDVASVYFGSIPSPSFTVESPTTILAIVPSGKGTVDVTVTASSRTSPVTPTDLYTYRRFKGKVKHHKNKLFVKTKWNKSAATVTGYEIFARKKKIATIPAQNKAQATIRLHPHHAHHEISNKYRHYVQHKYKVRAIDTDGTAGAFTFLNVHR